MTIKNLRSWTIRLGNLFRKERMDRDFDDELASHLAMHVEDNLRAGMAPETARRDALMKLGGIEQTKETVRERRGFVWMENVERDLRFSLRSLARSPGLSLTAIFALALGIGATTVVFSVAYNVFFEGLPYRHFNRLVVVGVRNLANTGGWKGRNYFLQPELRAFREHNHVFEDVVIHNGIRLIYDNGKTSHYWPLGGVVTTNTFDFLGVPPLLGRTFSKEDGRPGAPPVFVMNYHFWKKEFSGDPKILNAVFLLDDKPTTLVGIMPQRFNAFGENFWMPVSDQEADGELLGRLKPGVSVPTAGADLDAIIHGYREANPGGDLPLPERFAIVPQTMLDSMIGNFQKTVYALLAAVLLLLLLACADVANLLLVRATLREREMAVRATLGASRMRLIRQLLTESILLAAMASLVGCALAYFALKIVVAMIPAATLPEEMAIRLNLPVLLVSVGITVLTAVLCGLAPALHVVRGDLQPRLRGSGKGVGTGFRYGKLRAGLIVSEVALSIILLIGAGLLMRSFLILTHVDLGFDPKNVLYFRLTLPKAYNTDVDVTRVRKNALTRQILERLQSIPGVISAAESMQEPPLNYDWSDTIVPDKPHKERWETRYEICSEDYFKMLGILLIRGRLFSKGDINSALHVMVVNESFARQYFPNENILGKKVKLEVLDRKFLDVPHNIYFDVIGIVADYKTRGYDIPSWQDYPEVFIPYSVQGFSWRTYMARTAIDPDSILKNIRPEMQAIDPNLEIATSGTLEGLLKEFYRGPQFELLTLGAFAAIGLLLVVIGIFSVMAYTVSQQTHEIGIRMALGAQRENILKMVLAKSLGLIVGGVVIGLSVSYVVTRFLRSEISGISATDPWTFGIVAVVVVVIGLMACILPARRATHVDPLNALRYE